MTIFSTLENALREGFQWMEYLPEQKLHLIVKTFVRVDGLRVRALAYARAECPDPSR